MTKVIGITGGIGSGKTTLCKYLKKKDTLFMILTSLFLVFIKNQISAF